MNKNNKKYRSIIISIIVLVIIDQLLKILILKVGNKTLIEGILSLNITENKNGTYGINSNSTITYVLTNLVVTVIAYKFITSQNQFVDKKTKIFLTLIIAGGISNSIDRIFRGYVVEFVNITKLPIFNLADIYILIGWVSMVAIFTVFTAQEIKNRRIEKENKSKKE